MGIYNHRTTKFNKIEKVHTGAIYWNIILHNFYAEAKIYRKSPFSAVCAIYNSILAIWFFCGAPFTWPLIRKKQS